MGIVIRTPAVAFFLKTAQIVAEGSGICQKCSRKVVEGGGNETGILHPFKKTKITTTILRSHTTMAVSQQNVIYGKKREENETLHTQEHTATRHYTIHTVLINEASQPEGVRVTTSSQETSAHLWETGSEQRNRNISCLTQGHLAPLYTYDSIARQEATKGKSTTSGLPLDQENTSFQFNKVDLWSTTFQNSGWLDIYINTTMTNPSR